MMRTLADMLVPVAILIGVATLFYKTGVNDGRYQMAKEIRRQKRDENQ